MINKFKYEKRKKSSITIGIISLLVNLFIIWSIIQIFYVNHLVKIIFMIIVTIFLYVDFILAKLLLTYWNRGIIIESEKIILPFAYKFIYPRRKKIKQLDRNMVSLTTNIKKIRNFLNKNRVGFSDFHMVGIDEYKKDPSDFLPLRIKNEGEYIIILRKEWFSNYNDFFKEYVKK